MVLTVTEAQVQRGFPALIPPPAVFTSLPLSHKELSVMRSGILLLQS